jgi:hypothetical protein
MRRSFIIAALALAVAGCKNETGVMVVVKGPASMTSVDAGITKLDFVVAHPSWCERWVGVPPANHTVKDVSGRDLSKKPYEFVINPSHQTDLSEPVYVAALAYDASGKLVGEATFDAHPLSNGEVLRREAPIFLFNRRNLPMPPQYVSQDGCVCTPGEPWVGTGSGSGCDTRVITSFARLIDTAGCELTPKGAPLPVPVCDGQQYMNEPTDRDLPCWAADAQGACRVTARRCADHDGVAYAEECNVGSNDVMLPADSTLCMKYLNCEQDPCSDVAGCFRSSFMQTANVKCTVAIDPSTGENQPIKPCNGATNWTAPIITATTGGATCIAALVDGTDQPPYSLGFTVAGKMGPQLVSTGCPTQLTIDKIDAPYPAAVPDTKQIDVVAGEHLVHVTLQIQRSCSGGATLVCSPM